MLKSTDSEINQDCSKMKIETKTKLKLKLQERKEEADKERLMCDFVDVNYDGPTNENSSKTEEREVTNNILDPLSGEVNSATFDNARLGFSDEIQETKNEECEDMNLVESLLEVTMEVGENSVIDSRFKCDKCNAKFELLSDLHAHTLLEHAKRRRSKITLEDLDPSLLPNQCSICKKVLSKRSALSIHMRTHTGDSPYECKICNKKCKTRGNIKIHMRIHTGERPYVCNICNWKCQTVSHLKKHKVKHLSEKRYQCDVCKKKFKIIAHLKRHMMIHMDNRPHACHLCIKKYTQRNHLNKHMTEKHPSHFQ